MIDGAHFVQIKSFQEYVFKAKREGRGLKPNNGHKFGSAEDNPHEEIRQIQSVIKRYGGPQENNWDEDKLGRLYVASYPIKDSWIIWGGGRTGKDFVGRPNNISFQIQLQDAELASEFMKAITENPTPTLQMFMSRVFVDEQGQQLLPTDRVRTQHRQSMDPFLVPIAEVKAVEIKKPESRPAAVENRQSSDYNLTVSEVQRNAPPPAEALTPPERRYGVKIGWLAEGRSDKVAGGKPNGPEGNFARGGDDTAFALFAPQNNPDGVICFGVELDGVSQGEHGDEASIVAARALNKRLSLEMGSGSEAGSSRGPKQSKDRVAGYGAAAVVDANWAVNARKRELNLPVMATTLSLFALQESGGKLYLHSWNTGDSATMVYVETDKGEFLYPVTLPDDLISQVLGSRPGDRGSGYIDDNASDADIRIRVPDPSINWTIDELQKIYQEKAQALKISAGIEPGSGIEFALGFGDQAVIRYASIELPGVGEKYKEGTVKRVKVAAMCDGIENYSDFDQRLQACRQPTANGVAMELLRLGNIADADDRSVVAAEVVQTKEAEAFSIAEIGAISAVEVVDGLEKTSGILDREKLKESFLMARLTFGKLPQGSRVRTEIMKNVNVQLGAEAERLKKAGKPEAEIFEEWLKQVFIPLYRRTKTKP